MSTLNLAWMVTPPDRFHDRLHRIHGSVDITTAEADVPDGTILVIAAREPDDNDDLHWHLSVSFRPGPGHRRREPTLTELLAARDRFLPPDAVAALYPSTRGVLHLFERRAA